MKKTIILTLIMISTGFCREEESPLINYNTLPVMGVLPHPSIIVAAPLELREHNDWWDNLHHNLMASRMPNSDSAPDDHLTSLFIAHLQGIESEVFYERSDLDFKKCSTLIMHKQWQYILNNNWNIPHLNRMWNVQTQEGVETLNTQFKTILLSALKSRHLSEAQKVEYEEKHVSACIWMCLCF